MKTRAILLTAALLGAGCVLQSDEPLSDPATAEADPSMYGHWVVPPQPDDKTGHEIHLFIGKHKPEQNPQGIMECAMIAWDTKTLMIDGKPSKFCFTITEVGKDRYLNMLGHKDEKEPTDFSEEGSYAKWAGDKNHRSAIFRYACDGTTLQIWNYDSSMLKRLVKEKAIDRSSVDGDDYYIAKSLLKCLEKEDGEKLFSNVVFEAKKAP
jgi:hypothetical protein